MIYVATEPRIHWLVPDDRHFDRHHQWIQPRETLWAIGVTDYTQDTAGDILYIALPAPGTRLEEGRPFGSIESGKWVGQLYAPFNGIVIASNEPLIESPHLLNQDPYGQWLILASPDPEAPLPPWLSADEYRQQLALLEESR
ncbi:glycine cleavage system H protein [Sulfobacillus acidophilus TPY]|uniref:Glycine cleavage system H protein n=1 Tax=Sulfobacillus acidophilus (strain ATCC 700253 / DSM 10332 / NAL) TaxID=679936 RepID=G8TZ66_SULAD|nr:glycine cleavage system H protein [Sulfobacillus acidophilus TPY]AEW06336.1 Glycine cleavage system H protein [Sulfobacillus acidophilus DSM 10332]